MPRIQLSFWHGKHAPGDEIDVSDAELSVLKRDGRVAAVLAPLEAAQPDQHAKPADDAPAPEMPAEPGRRRR